MDIFDEKPFHEGEGKETLFNQIHKYRTLHEFACHPCAGTMLIFSVSFQFYYMYHRS